MPPDSNIPLGKWIIDGLIAFGTVGAVIVALFGLPFARKFFPPKLKLTLPEPFGSVTPVKVLPTTLGLAAQQHPMFITARYCLLTVSNGRLWTPATKVRVSLLRVEELGPDGK